MQRYMADLTICSMIHDHISLMYCVTIIWSYPLVWNDDKKEVRKYLQKIGSRFLVAMTSEFIFNTVSIFILTWYQNRPIVRLWMTKWKSYVKTNTLICTFVVSYVTQYLIGIADEKYLSAHYHNSTLHHNGTQRYCNSSLFF